MRVERPKRPKQLHGRVRPVSSIQRASSAALVTFCNTGPTPERQTPVNYPHCDCALVNLSTGDVREISLGDQGASGMAYVEGGEAIIAVQADSSLVRLSPQLRVLDRHLDDRLIDTHSLAATASSLFAVSTGRDCVLEYQRGEDHLELRTIHRLTESGTDTLHVNSVCVHQGRVLVSMFGEGWRDQPVDALTGSIIDLESRQVVSTSIRHPHSLFSKHDTLYVLGSAFGTVEQILPGGERIVCVTYPGYLRGLSVFEGGALVGVSRQRHLSRGPGKETVDRRDHCGILRFDQNWELIDFVDLSWVGPEIFEIAPAISGISVPATQDTLTTAKRRIGLFEAAWRAPSGTQAPPLPDPNRNL
jgi:hypothetical protein